MLGKGGGGWGVEAVGVAVVGERPAAVFGLVGGGVDLLIIWNVLVGAAWGVNKGDGKGDKIDR